MGPNPNKHIGEQGVSNFSIFTRPYTLDQVKKKQLFFNFKKCQADLRYILIDKQMLGKVFGSNIKYRSFTKL